MQLSWCCQPHTASLRAPVTGKCAHLQRPVISFVTELCQRVKSLTSYVTALSH